MHTAANANLLRAWMRRREAKGHTVTADELWAKIKTQWPKSEEWQHEWLFNAAAGRGAATPNYRLVRLER